MKNFRTTAAEIGELVEKKNAAYGSSFAKCGEFLRLLYPDGMKPEQYGDALMLARIFDKQMRIATAKDALGENPYRDIAGYGILGATPDTYIWGEGTTAHVRQSALVAEPARGAAAGRGWAALEDAAGRCIFCGRDVPDIAGNNCCDYRFKCWKAATTIEPVAATKRAWQPGDSSAGTPPAYQSKDGACTPNLEGAFTHE